jgi:hypothetical protein
MDLEGMHTEEISVTQQFRKYRDFLRYSWNTLVAEDKEMVHSYEVFDVFRQYRTLLLRLIFYDFLPEDSDEWFDLEHLDLIIRPVESDVFFAYDRGSGVGEINFADRINFPDGTTFKPLTFFDIGNMGSWDLQYVEVVIVACPDEALIGKRALTESRWVEVSFVGT